MPNPIDIRRPWILGWAPEQTIVVVRCRGCRKLIQISVRPEQIDQWLGGALASEAFRHLGNDLRELLIGGTCGKCIDKQYIEPPVRQTAAEELKELYDTVFEVGRYSDPD